MPLIAAAIIGAAVILAGTHAYLTRYDVLVGSSAISYRLHDRWTHRLTVCTRDEGGRSDPSETTCEDWTPVAGGKP